MGTNSLNQNLMVSPQDHIIIVGAGTFGLSTAVELLRKGHKNLTLIDSYPIPSPLSAGNDVNKVFQSTVEDEFYSSLAQEALLKWRSDELYKPAFNEVGIIYGGSGKQAVNEINRRYNVVISKGEDATRIDSPEEFARLVRTPQDDGMRFKGWTGYHQKSKCGWTFASMALENVWKECKGLGAKFICEEVENLIYEQETSNCTGVRTVSGQIFKSTKTIICAGANSVKLLDFKGLLLAKCWTVGHIKLTDEEAAALKGIPVVLNIDEGFFFEPDINNELKLCNEFPGYINMDTEKKYSIPTYRNAVPKEAQDQMRDFLRQVFPESIATREFKVCKICWCTDTPDRHFLICEHPDHKGLILGTGDSGKGFKYMPIIGEYISEVALKGNNALDERKRAAWSWRPQQAVDRDIFDLQQRLGGLNIIKDLRDVSEWTTK